MQNIRVRFAPSPTGALHIGGVRTALYNYLLAKKHGGTFVLRIEDTDRSRYVPGAEKYITEALEWCGIMPSEGLGLGGDLGPYRQSDRKEIYQKYAQILLDKGHAYYAFDTPEELTKMRESVKHGARYDATTRMTMRNSLTLSKEEVQALLDKGTPYTLRLKIPTDEVITIHDLVRGAVQFQSNELDDKVMLKGDGMPTYHLANIVDDYLMKITHVIRGEEWLPSTAHHVYLYRFFDWEESMPQFAHLPLILNPSGKGKLSKRDGKKFGFPVFPLAWKAEKEEDSFTGFREFGFDSEAVVNFLAFLGWNPGTEQEIFSLEELCEAFSIERIGKSGARFDIEKATWFNQQYLIAKSDKEIATTLMPLAKEAGYTCSETYLTQVAGLMKERVNYKSDFLKDGYYFFEGVKAYDEKTIRKRWKMERVPKFEILKGLLNDLEDFSPASVESCVKGFITAQALKFGDVLPILRIALSGTMKGPDLFTMMSVIGKNTVLERLEKAYADFNIIHANKVAS